MSSTEHRDGKGVPRQYDWRAYETPTKTTARVLEDLVGSGESPKSHRTKSSSTGSFVVVEPHTHGMGTGMGTGTQPLTPLPVYPPTYHPESASESNISPPPPPPPPPIHPHAKSESDVTENDDRSSQFHRARDSISSNDRRRMSEEEARAHHRNAESPKRTSVTSTTTTTTTTGPSPTDSHPQRHHTAQNQNQNQNHNQNHTRSHAKSRSSSESLSSLLLVTTERLSRETARANEAERNASEIMSLFKNTYEAKVRLERDLIRVQQELETYKIQLNVAQKEIYRAQEVVDRVDRERAAAQEEAARGRDKIHKLNEARAVHLAMEEGRRSGFEEGLRQGRRVQPVMRVEPEPEPEGEGEGSRRHRHRQSRSDEVSRYTYPDQYQDSDDTRRRRGSSSRPPQPERHVSKAPQPVPVPPIPSSAPPPPPPPTHRHGTPPDVGNFQQLLPRPTITTPMPVRVPSTQPQPPPPMPPHQAPMHQHHQQQRRSSQPAAGQHPEKIAVQPSGTSNGGGGRIHPIPVWNATPSVMHERIDLPPDNYIPTMDENSMISLPPPHELSRPVPAEAPPLLHPQAPVPVPPQPQPQTEKKADQAQRPRSQAQGRQVEKRRSLRLVDHDREERETIKSKDYAYSYSQDRERREKARHADDDDDGASSFKHSTLSGPPSRQNPPPRGDAYESRSAIGDGGREDYGGAKRYENPVYRVRAADDGRVHAVTPSPPQRIAQEWRDANREYITPPGKTVNVEPPRPPSAAQSIPRPPSRRAREVVMPVPLADVFMNTLKSPPLDGQPFSDRTTPFGSNVNNAVPGIEVVTPSTHASARLSLRTVVDPVLLSPDSANRPLPLPLPLPDQPPTQPRSQSTQQPIDVVRQEDGTYFLPLSPAMSMMSPVVKPGPFYPPGFAPSLPTGGRDRETLGADFKYPSSPLRR